MSRRGRLNRLGRKAAAKVIVEEVEPVDFPLYQTLRDLERNGNLSAQLEEFEDQILTQIVSKLESSHGEMIDAIILHHHLVTPGLGLPKPRCHFGGRGVTYKLSELPDQLILLIKIYILKIAG